MGRFDTCFGLWAARANLNQSNQSKVYLSAKKINHSLFFKVSCTWMRELLPVLHQL